MRSIAAVGRLACLGTCVCLWGPAARECLAEDPAVHSVPAPATINPLRLGSKTRGKPSGRWAEWRGGAKWVGEYQHGQRHGVWEGTVPLTESSHFAEPEYADFESPLTIRVELHQNVPHGAVSGFDAQERPVFTWHLDQGVLEGKAVWWHADGQVRRQATYRAGLLDGLVTEWDASGNVKKQETYHEGRASQSHIRWHERGQKQYEGYANVAGKVKRDAFDWLELRWSQAVVEEHASEERCGRWTSWYPNGQKKIQGSYLNGEAEGRFTWWHENGQKMAEGEFISGKRHGVWRWWHSTGRKEVEGEYQYGQVSGQWETWSADGVATKVDRSRISLKLDWDEASELQTANRAAPLGRPTRDGTTAVAAQKPITAPQAKKPAARTPTASPVPRPTAPKHAPSLSSPEPEDEFSLLGFLRIQPQQHSGQSPNASARPLSSPSVAARPRASTPSNAPQYDASYNIFSVLLGLEAPAPSSQRSPGPRR